MKITLETAGAQIKIISPHLGKHLLIKNDHDKINCKTSKFFTLILALFLGLSVSSCSVIGGIFKTGMEVGIFITVAVIVLIIALILRVRKRRN